MAIIGKLISMAPNGLWGFIELSTLRNEFDEDDIVTLEGTTKDVYLHRSDLGQDLVVGSEIIFNVIPDTRRKNAYRAESPMVYVPKPPGIELHIDEKTVDNPGVPMRWCFSPEMHRRIIEGLKKGYGYGVMLVAKQAGDTGGFREIREIRGWMYPFTVLTFGAPGDWDVSTILFERTRPAEGRSASYVLEQQLTSYLSTTKLSTGHYIYDTRLTDLHELAKPKNFNDNAVLRCVDDITYGVAIAMRTISVSVPKGIFADEPSEALKAYANYFFRHNAVDQCEMRQRLMLMTPGVIPWFIAEGVKRVSFMVGGIVGMLFWLNGSPGAFMQAFKPAIKLDMPPTPDNTGSDHMKPFNKAPRGWFTPGMLIVYVFTAWLFKVYLLSHAINLATWAWSLLKNDGWMFVAGAAALALIGFIIYLVAKRVIEYRKATAQKRRATQQATRKTREQIAKQQSLAESRRMAAVAEAQTSALVCGDAPAQVALKAIPKELRTKHMLFASFVRGVCRPFAR